MISRQRNHSHVTGLPQHCARRCVRREGRRREGAHRHGRHPRKRRRSGRGARPHQPRDAQDRPVNTSPHTNWDASARQSRHDRGGSLKSPVRRGGHEAQGHSWWQRACMAFRRKYFMGMPPTTSRGEVGTQRTRVDIHPHS